MRAMKPRLLLLLALAACGDDEGTPASPDAAAAADAAPSEDGTPVGDACPVADYAPCGGALDGAWSVVGHCQGATEDVPCENPFSGTAACDAAGNSAA